jgi:hypothetical protein
VKRLSSQDGRHDEEKRGWLGIHPSQYWILFLAIGLILLAILVLLFRRKNGGHHEYTFVGLKNMYPPGMDSDEETVEEEAEEEQRKRYKNSRHHRSSRRSRSDRESRGEEEYDSNTNSQFGEYELSSIEVFDEDGESENGHIREDSEPDPPTIRTKPPSNTPSLSTSPQESIFPPSTSLSLTPPSPISSTHNFSVTEALARKRKNESKGEAVCRAAFEQLYAQPFRSTRPDFLKNPETGSNLELDGYNGELKLAFEYNGQQHYTFPNRWHSTKEMFEAQVRRDIFKQEICRRVGICLITVPYTIPHDQIYEYILLRVNGNSSV